MKTVIESLPGCYGDPSDSPSKEACRISTKFAVIMTNGTTLYVCEDHLAPCVRLRNAAKVCNINTEFYFDDGVPEVKAVSDR